MFGERFEFGSFVASCSQVDQWKIVVDQLQAIDPTLIFGGSVDALHAAVGAGHSLESLKFLIHLEFDPHAQDKDGQSCLDKAKYEETRSMMMREWQVISRNAIRTHHTLKKQAQTLEERVQALEDRMRAQDTLIQQSMTK